MEPLHIVLMSVYITIAIVIFLISLFFSCLGGKDSDLWKPFVYAIFWPFYLILSLLGYQLKPK
jgi:uncharacterized membrane protein